MEVHVPQFIKTKDRMKMEVAFGRYIERLHQASRTPVVSASGQSAFVNPESVTGLVFTIDKLQSATIILQGAV